ncbi:MAG: hypothetical protein U0636_11840 [Phycisphaerales bacterium]
MALGGQVGGTTALASLTAAGTVAISGGGITTGDQHLGTVTLGAATTLRTTSGGDIDIDGTVNGSNALTVDADGTTTFHSAIGNTTALSSITLSSPAMLLGGLVQTTGAQTYGQVTLGANTTLASTSSGTISLNGAFSGQDQWSVAVNTAGVSAFNGTVTQLLSISTDAPGTNSLAGTLAALQDITLLGASTVGSSGATLSSSSGGITFGSTLDGAGSVYASAGTVNFNGAVGSTQALTSLEVDGTAVISGGSVTTSGQQTYQAVQLDADTSLASTAAGIIFNGAVNGAHALSVDSATSTVVNATIGGTTALTTFTTAGQTTLAGGSVHTTGNQTYGALDLAASTLLDSSAGTVFLNGAVNGAHALTIDAASTVLASDVGGQTRLTSLTISGPVTMAGASVDTSGTQTYGATTLTGNTQLESASGNIVFTSTVDGARALSTSAGVATQFNGAVGGTTALSSLTVDGTALVSGGSVRTTGAQTYQQLELGASAALTSTGGGALTLDGVAGNNHALSLSSSGDTSLNGTLTGLSSFLADGGGNTILGGNLTASGAINIQDDVMLLAGSHSLTSTLASVLLGGTVDGHGSLTLSAGTTSTVQGAVGATQALQSLSATGALVLNGGSVTTTGDISLDGTLTVGANTVLHAGDTLHLDGTANAGAYDLTLQGSLVFGSGATVSAAQLWLQGSTTGNGSLALHASETLWLQGNVHTQGALDLGTPTLLVLAGSIDSLGDLHFNSAVRVQGSRTITSREGGSVYFLGTIDGTTPEHDSLLVNSSGLTSFASPVGSLVKMDRFETDAPGTVQVAPSANAVFVHYGEIQPPTPSTLEPGVYVTRAASTMWYAPATTGLKWKRQHASHPASAVLDAMMDAMLDDGAVP